MVIYRAAYFNRLRKCEKYTFFKPTQVLETKRLNLDGHNTLSLHHFYRVGMHARFFISRLLRTVHLVTVISNLLRIIYTLQNKTFLPPVDSKIMNHTSK